MYSNDLFFIPFFFQILTALIAFLTTCYMLKNIQEMIGGNSVIGTLTEVIVAFEMVGRLYSTL